MAHVNMYNSDVHARRQRSKKNTSSHTVYRVVAHRGNEKAVFRLPACPRSWPLGAEGRHPRYGRYWSAVLVETSCPRPHPRLRHYFCYPGRFGSSGGRHGAAAADLTLCQPPHCSWMRTAGLLLSRRIHILKRT